MEIDSQDPFVELDAMRKIAEVLTPLGSDARVRVLKWCSEKFGSNGVDLRPMPSIQAKNVLGLPDPRQSNAQSLLPNAAKPYGSIAEFFAASNPQSESDKVAVLSYWLQVYEGHDDLDSQRVNTELKHLGHGVSNVTAAFSALMNRKPQLVIQTRKTGTSQQARKKYLLTSEGKKFVEGLLSQAP